MKITEQQFFDYMSCPALFEMRFLRKIPLENKTSTPKLLNQVSRFFFLNLLNGRICSTSELKNKWDSICAKHEDQMTPNKVLEGISQVMKLYQWASDEKIVVLDIDTPYMIQEGGIELIGNLGTILAAPNNKHELLITDFSNRLPDQTLIDMKLSYTLQAYAYYKVHNKFVSGIRIHSVKHNKNFFTSRTDGDFERLKTAMRSVGKSIQDELYYPREGMCSTCPAKSYCRYWNYTSEGAE